MKDSKIGIVTMEYAQTGKIIQATFAPIMVVELEEELFYQLEEIKPTTDPAVLRSNADLVMASWFTRTNEIELADREKFSIVSDIIDCRKYETGQIKKCVIEYTFKKIA